MKGIRWILRAIPIVVGALLVTGVAVLWLGRIDSAVEAPGEIRVERFQQVRPQVGGVVAQVLARPGEKVERGQVLLRLEDYELARELLTVERELGAAEAAHSNARQQRDLYAQEVQLREARQRRAEVHRLEIEAARARARSEEIAAHLGMLRRQQARTEQLWQGGLMSAQSVDAAREEAVMAQWRLRQAELDIQAAEAQLGAAREGLELLQTEQKRRTADLESEESQARIRVERLQSQLARLRPLIGGATVKAEMAGIVVGPEAEELVGRRVGSGDEVYTIIDPTAVTFVSYVSEEAILKVAVGQSAYVEVLGVPKRRFEVFMGEVQRVEADPLPRTDHGPTLYPVRVSLGKPWIETGGGRFYLRNGMQGNATIVSRPNVPLVRVIYDLLVLGAVMGNG